VQLLWDAAGGGATCDGATPASSGAKEKTALGFTNRDGDITGTLSGEQRAPR
jgi:hypothetical protein